MEASMEVVPSKFTKKVVPSSSSEPVRKSINSIFRNKKNSSSK